jgi:hypothetical protein
MERGGAEFAQSYLFRYLYDGPLGDRMTNLLILLVGAVGLEPTTR